MTQLRNHPARRAFTLIELLIVVAIIAIITGGSMAVLTGPMFERVRAEDQEAFEAGAGVFFAALVHDAHRAAAMDADSTGTITLVFEPDTDVMTTDTVSDRARKQSLLLRSGGTRAPRTSGTIVFSINNDNTLTRAVDGLPGAKLVPAVQSLIAERLSTGSLWSVSLTAKLRGYDGKPTTVTRRMDILAGTNAWAGGA